MYIYIYIYIYIYVLYICLRGGMCESGVYCLGIARRPSSMRRGARAGPSCDFLPPAILSRVAIVIDYQ